MPDARAMTGTGARTGALAAPLATIYVGILFALPAKALDPTAYAMVILGLSGAYLAIFFRDIARRLPVPEYFLLAGLVLGYVLLSRLGLLREADRLFSTARVLPQAAGLLIMLITLPAFTHAAHALFVPRVRLVPIGLVSALLAYSMLNWQVDEQMLRDNGLYGVLSPGMMLQFAWFALALRFEHKVLRFALVLLPLPFLLAASNVAIQLVLAIGVLLPRPRAIIPLLAALLAAVTLAIAFPPPQLEQLIAGDDNTQVRSRLWNQALDQIPQHPLGVGFGHSSVTLEGLKDPWVRHVFSQEVSRSLEVSNHSSFIDIALRMGWAGLALFLLMIRRAWRSSQGAGLDMHATGALAFMLVECAFNPVLESVRATLFFAFALGYLLALRPLDEAAPDDAARGEGALPLEPLSPPQRRRMLAGQARI